MKDPQREALRREGERRLCEEGIPPDAPPAAYEEWIGRSKETDLAIARRLGAVASPESVEVLERLAARTADRQVDKEIRRSFYRLEQRGMKIRRSTPAPEPLPVIQGPAVEGILSPLDGSGDRLVWLLRRRPGGLVWLFALLNDPEGLRSVDFQLTSRKRLKAFRSDLEREYGGIRMVEADATYCDFLIYRAFLWARERNNPIDGDYNTARSQILSTPPPEGDMPCPVLSLMDVEAIRADGRALSESVELLNEEEFGAWIFNRDEVQPFVDEMQAVTSSPLVLSEVQQKERMGACVGRAVAELFQGERGRSYARRLQEMAYFFLLTGREQAARQALAVSLALSESTRGGLGIPFCEALVYMSLGLWVSEAEEEETERRKTSLVVTPSEVAQEWKRRGMG